MIDVNLLPKDKIKKIKIEHYNTIVTIICIVVLVVVLFIAQAMAMRKNAKKNQLAELKKEITVLDQRVYSQESIDLRNKARLVEDKLKAVSEVKKDKQSIPRLIEVLTTMIPEYARVDKFQLSKESLEVTGTVGTLEELAQIVKIFQERKLEVEKKEIYPFLSFHHDITGFGNPKLGERVGFKFRMQLNPELVRLL